jgi:hypothetical protein
VSGRPPSGRAEPRMSQDEMWRRAEAAADFVFSPHLIGRLARVDAVTVAMRALMQLERDRAASAIEARSGETVKLGSTEGESAASEAGDAQ